MTDNSFLKEQIKAKYQDFLKINFESINLLQKANLNKNLL